MIIAAFLFGGKEVGESYRKILSCSGIGGTDYLRDNGGAATILNMAVNGLFATIFILGVGGELNGPTIGGIFTIVGFSATGKHIRNIAPIMFGVLFAGFTKRWTINSPSPMLALFILNDTGADCGGIRSSHGTSRRIPALFRRLECRNCVWRHEFI